MDIEYLLFLQNFRNSINDAWTPFMENISLFAISYIVLLPVFVYWCLNKKSGLYIFTALHLSRTLNAAVKLTACVYRPWVRDARVLPAGDAISTAGGYSFPSGHTMMSGPIYGGMAVYTRKVKWLSALFILALLVTGFSRNYLGVHTPQDVLIGLILTVLVLYVTSWIFNYVEAHPEKENMILALEFLFALCVLIYINVKSYPMDYIDGKLLVDPERMKRDAWGDAGGLLAFVPAYYLEKKFVKFSATGFNFKGIVLFVIGIIPLCWMLANLKAICINMCGYFWGNLVNRTILTFYIITIWPAVMKLFEKKS